MRRTLFQSVTKPPLTEPAPGADDPDLLALAAAMKDVATTRLGRSLAIRHASPRHADVLLATGPVTHNMREALRRTYDAMPAPKWVVAAGACALDGGLYAESYACVGGVAAIVPVDLHIPGCPPSPIMLLKGLLALMMKSAA
jgi:NADH:ubiquinone oxidoreductase subunit B-like Fe-S oxidoreductase